MFEMLELLAKEELKGQMVVLGCLFLFAAVCAYKFFSISADFDPGNKITPKCQNAQSGITPICSLATVFILVGIALGMGA